MASDLFVVIVVAVIAVVLVLVIGLIVVVVVVVVSQSVSQYMKEGYPSAFLASSRGDFIKEMRSEVPMHHLNAALFRLAVRTIR